MKTYETPELLKEISGYFTERRVLPTSVFGLLILILFLFSMIVLSAEVFAQNCSSPPTGSYSPAWARQYQAWCEACGGKFSMAGGNPSCSPGANWGRTGQGSAGVSSSMGGAAYQAGYQLGQGLGKLLFGDPQEEQARAIQNQQIMQSLDAFSREHIRQEDAILSNAADQARRLDDQLRDETLSSLTGIPRTAELTPKPATDFFGIPGNPKGDISSEAAASANPVCEWGTMDSSVVDLRCLGLDPNKPIAVDPNVVRGKERVFPAQPDPKTFENVNYNKGFEALMRFDVASAAAAVEYFKQAQKERPNDPLVRNALLLAQDILKARQQKEKDDQFWCANFTLRGYAAMMMGDNEKAKGYIAQARKFDPNNDEVKFVESLVKLDLGPEGTYPARKDAYRFVANSLVSISKRDIAAAVAMLEAAQRLQPGDKVIGALLLQMRNYEAGRASANTGK